MKPTTLITGGAKRIGAELVRHLAGAGHDLVVHYHQSRVDAEALAAELRAAHGTKVTLVQADLQQLPQGAALWDGLPSVTNIIHNAAVFERDRMDNFTAVELRRHLAVNVEAPLLLTQWFLAQLPEGVTGNVIVLGDGTKGWSVSPEFFSYAVSKLAWESLIDLLAASCAPRARANVIALGPTLAGAKDGEAMLARVAARAVGTKTSNPHEVCAAVDFLLASPAITGQIISLAGGFGLTTYRPV